jgi:hypothetical protein
MAYPTSDDMKIWLRLPPDADTELDSRLDELIAAAIAHVETAAGQTFSTSTPERISLAIKFLAGYWFENPIPADKDTDAAFNAVSILIAGDRIWSFPSV